MAMEVLWLYSIANDQVDGAYYENSSTTYRQFNFRSKSKSFHEQHINPPAKNIIQVINANLVYILQLYACQKN